MKNSNYYNKINKKPNYSINRRYKNFISYKLFHRHKPWYYNNYELFTFRNEFNSYFSFNNLKQKTLNNIQRIFLRTFLCRHKKVLIIIFKIKKKVFSLNVYNKNEEIDFFRQTLKYLTTTYALDAFHNFFFAKKNIVPYDNYYKIMLKAF